MDIYTVFAIAFLGVFVITLLCHQTAVLCRRFLPVILGWIVRHIVLPRIFRGRHLVNPTRVELLCYIVHWTLTIIYNTYRVDSLPQAATRAAQMAVIHVVPLLAARQLSFASHILGLPLGIVYRIHLSLGIMATLQGVLHSIVKIRDMDKWSDVTVFGTIAIFAFVVLSVLPFVKHYIYEVFLYSHRIIALVAAVALGGHLRIKQTSSRTLLFITLCLFITSSLWHYSRQIYHDINWDSHGIELVRTVQAQQYGESLILELQLSRPWKINPGQHIYLTLLTFDSASIFQRHPFVITWWKHLESKSHARFIYIMIDPQRGWTKRMQRRPSLLSNRYAWLDGPFGATRTYGDYGTVVLFSSGSGIFAQLPLIKGLTDESKFSAIRTRRIKLIWQTDQYHDQLQEWIQSIIDDKDIDKELLDISIHKYTDSTAGNGKALSKQRRIVEIGQRVRVVYDIPDVGRYIAFELEGSKKSMAVVVSGHHQLRHDVRTQVLQEKHSSIRLFELDFQPQYRARHSGGTAA